MIIVRDPGKGFELGIEKTLSGTYQVVCSIGLALQGNNGAYIQSSIKSINSDASISRYYGIENSKDN